MMSAVPAIYPLVTFDALSKLRVLDPEAFDSSEAVADAAAAFDKVELSHPPPTWMISKLYDGNIESFRAAASDVIGALEQRASNIEQLRQKVGFLTELDASLWNNCFLRGGWKATGVRLLVARERELRASKVRAIEAILKERKGELDRDDDEAVNESEDILNTLRDANEARFEKRRREDRREMDDFLRFEQEVLVENHNADESTIFDGNLDAKIKDSWNAREGQGLTGVMAAKSESHREADTVQQLEAERFGDDHREDIESHRRFSSTQTVLRGPRIPVRTTIASRDRLRLLPSEASQATSSTNDTVVDWNEHVGHMPSRAADVEAVLNELVMEANLNSGSSELVQSQVDAVDDPNPASISPISSSRRSTNSPPPQPSKYLTSLFPGLAKENQRRAAATDAVVTAAQEIPTPAGPAPAVRSRPGSTGSVSGSSLLTATGSAVKGLTVVPPLPDLDRMDDSSVAVYVAAKVEELRREIARYKRAAEEAETLRKAAEDREKAAKDEEVSLRRQRAELDAQLAQLAAQRREFKRDKTKWEKQKEASEVLPTKKDRSEIVALQNQITHLNAALQQAKLRASLDKDRLERRIEDLTKRNSELVDEVRSLERERAGFLEREMTRTAVSANLQQTAKSRAHINSKTYSPTVPNGRKTGDGSSAEVTDFSRSLSEPRTAVTKRPSVPARGGLSVVKVSQKPRASASELSAAAPAAEGRAGIGQSSVTQSASQPPMVGPPDSSLVNSDVTDRLDALERNLSLSASFQAEYVLEGGGIRRTYTDGTLLEARRGGVVKETWRDGRMVVRYGNGDTRETIPGDRETYTYAATRTQVTTYKDGLRVCVFENGQTEYRFGDGSECIVYTDGTKKFIGTDGEEELEYPDGTRAGQLFVLYWVSALRFRSAFLLTFESGTLGRTMEVLEEKSARLCDSEVITLVRESQSARPKEKRSPRIKTQSELATVEHQLITYFKDLNMPSLNQTADQVRHVQAALKPYNLKRNEQLQIVNSRPSFPVELAILLEDPEFHENNLDEMLAIISASLPLAPINPATKR
ncbi:hypothetical protein HDU93_000350 [Gonapodya sp. JEL0774]|nr:hypothetical protein HDU93_000350 [Gonapodya sp. JEL0774]